jgi:hypothetical protein
MGLDALVQNRDKDKIQDISCIERRKGFNICTLSRSIVNKTPKINENTIKLD